MTPPLEQTRELDRRTLLAAGGLLGVGALGTPTGTAGAFAAAKADPVSMAMHIHGSFSEGTASMDAHLHQARRLGVDVVWWTDHDFRKTAFGYRDAVGFDGPHEYDGPWDFTWVPVTTDGLADSGQSFVSSPANPDESGDKLRLTAAAAAGADWSTFLVEGQAQNLTYSTSYSDTTVVLDVRPQLAGGDSRAVVEVVSSYRPPRAGRPAGQYRIQYRLGGPTGYSTEEGGLLGVVGLAAGAVDQWRRLTLDLRSDHARLWPDTVAGDASLWRLRLGAQVRNGATAQVLFDRLRFQRTRKTNADANALLLDAIAQYRDRYPRITQFAAAEISLVNHLNAFGGDGAMPVYSGSQAIKDGSVEAQRAMVKFLHSRGATVSLNHPLIGVKSPADLARRLVATNGLGADVIEIGTGPATGKLGQVFDIAARNGVFITANGTTDDHDGEDWLDRGRRWLTQVWSPTKRRGDLCHALEAGRAWFYDPLYFNGTLDLRVEGNTAMGGVLFTGKRKVDVSVRATGLPAGSKVAVVIGRCDLAGVDHLATVNRVRVIPASQFRRGHAGLRVDRGSGVFVRAVVRLGGDGSLVAFSNPVWVLPPSRRGQVRVPAARR